MNICERCGTEIVGEPVRQLRAKMTASGIVSLPDSIKCRECADRDFSAHIVGDGYTTLD